MGNYKDLEFEFIERTMELITQYNSIVDQFEFEKQYNYTLLINCLLGLIVMPKEMIMSFVPSHRLTSDFKNKIGLEESIINGSVKNLQHLIQLLRNSVAHFDISVISENDEDLIDWIEFKNSQNNEETIIKFKATEILPFLEYYTNCLLKNLNEYRK